MERKKRTISFSRKGAIRLRRTQREDRKYFTTEDTENTERIGRGDFRGRGIYDDIGMTYIDEKYGEMKPDPFASCLP